MKTFKWTIEIEVDQTWVEDGFDLQDGRDLSESVGQTLLPYAHSHEVKVKCLSGPSRKEVARAQGYPTVKDMDADNKRVHG